jgi:DNA-binding response OmpR family regulator
LSRRPRVLVIHACATTSQQIRSALEAGGVTVLAAADGQTGLRLFFESRPALVALDLDLPDKDGWNVLQRMRELSDVPIMLLTASPDAMPAVRALRSGADDCVREPFSAPELLARVEALLRRSATATGVGELPVHADAFVAIDYLDRRVLVAGIPVELTPIEFKLLSALVRHRNQVLSRPQLVELVWGAAQADPNEVKVYVSYLRRKLREVGVDPVETVRGFGYRYKPRRLESAAIA